MRNFLLVRTDTHSELPKDSNEPVPYQPKIAGEGVQFSGGKCIVSWGNNELSIFESLAKLEMKLGPYVKLVWRDYEGLFMTAKALVNNWYEFDGPAAGFEERLHYFDMALKELEKEF